MAIKTNINKDQQKELKAVLVKLKVPSKEIDELMTSQVAPNTYKAYRQGKRIVTKDGQWIIHFGAKWAKQAAEKATASVQTKKPTQKSISPDETLDIPTIDEEMLPDSPQLMVDMPDINAPESDKPIPQPTPSRFAKSEQIMVSFQMEKEYLMAMQKQATKQGVNVNILFRLAVKQFLGK
jgi:hypothetical protein